ncbi:hypothetical protein [Sulfurospirillum sp.]|uniref:hypothetical protein n=1 Tax=Sulfurospirillum sp. TaxID=2053622 RepID=UPI002FDD108C
MNTNLGCRSNCSYCYLPILDLKLGKVPNQEKSVTSIINYLLSHPLFIQGKQGTILSIGCYSECWDEINKSATIELLNFLLTLENPIQIATKQFIHQKEIRSILDKIVWCGQLSIYISSATISFWNKYEKGTCSPLERFKSFNLKKEKKELLMFLYLKPVLENITIKDIELYSSLIEKYDIDVIVGETFNAKVSEKISSVGDEKLYIQDTSDDYKNICKDLSNLCIVYSNSIEPIEKIREKMNG